MSSSTTTIPTTTTSKVGKNGVTQRPERTGHHLVPETLLKKKNDLDRLSLERKSQLKALGNRKNFAGKAKFERLSVRKVEKFVVQSKSQVHAKARHDRVLKKGLQSKKPKANASTNQLTSSEGLVIARGSQADIDDVKRLATLQGSTSTLAHEVIQTNSLTAKFVFAIRIRPDHNLPKKVLKTLSALRLRTQYSGVFINYNAASKVTLDLISPYIVYGMVTEKTVTDLLKRRGYCKVEGNRTPLSDNTIIERVLGSIGVICLEDIIQIINQGNANSSAEEFKTVNNFIWPFVMSDEEGGFSRNKLGNVLGKGDVGDRGGGMEGVVRAML